MPAYQRAREQSGDRQRCRSTIPEGIQKGQRCAANCACQRQTVDKQSGPQNIPGRQLDTDNIAVGQLETRRDRHFNTPFARPARHESRPAPAPGSTARAHGCSLDFDDCANAAGIPHNFDNGALRILHDELAIPAPRDSTNRLAYRLRRIDFAICSTVICGTCPTAVTR